MDLLFLGVPPFHEKVTEKLLTRKPTEIFQINVGLYCNQACSHCHVESSPKRKEVMSIDVADQCLNILSNSPSISIVDLTGELFLEDFLLLVKDVHLSMYIHTLGFQINVRRTFINCQHFSHLHTLIWNRMFIDFWNLQSKLCLSSKI